MPRQASSPVFFVEAPGRPVSLFPRQMRGGWRAKWRNHCSVVPRSLSRTRAPLGAPSRRSSFRRPGTLCGGPPTCGRPPSASSWRAARSGHRVEPRRRPSACLRGTPAGAASCSIIKTPLDDALDEQDKIGLSSSRNKVNSVARLPPAPCFRPAWQAARAPGHRLPSQAIRLCARPGQWCRQKAA